MTTKRQKSMITTASIQFATFVLSLTFSIILASYFLKPLTILSDFARYINQPPSKSKKGMDEFSGEKAPIATIPDVIIIQSTYS